MNPLKNGVAGKEIVAYFEENYDREPVNAETLGTDLNVPNVYSYKLTFSNGAVASYRLTFAENSFKVVNAERIA